MEQDLKLCLFLWLFRVTLLSESPSTGQKAGRKPQKPSAHFFCTLAISAAIFKGRRCRTSKKNCWVPPLHTFLMGWFCQFGPTSSTSLHSIRLKQLLSLGSPTITFPREDPEGVIIFATTWIIYSNFPSSKDSQNSSAWSQRSQLFQGFSPLLPSILGISILLQHWRQLS